MKATGYPSPQPLLSCRNPVALTSRLATGRIPQWLATQILERATRIQTPTLALLTLRTLDKSLEVTILVLLPFKRQKWGEKPTFIALPKRLNSGIYAKHSDTVPCFILQTVCAHIAYPYPRYPEYLFMEGNS